MINFVFGKNLNKLKLPKKGTKSGFTIVELLIVIVIIGILAAIIIVSYIGISKRATESSLQSDLKIISNLLEMDKVSQESYPNSKESANGGSGLKASQGTDLEYSYNSGDDSYCVTATKSGISYFINSIDKTPKEGVCVVVPESFVASWGGSDDDNASGVIQTKDGGFIATGNTQSYSSGDKDVFFAKYSEDGNVVWVKTWGGNGNDSPNSIIQTNDGDIMIAGQTESYGNGSESLLAKFTINGDLLWVKTWGGNGNDYASSLIQNGSGDIIVSGLTSEYENNGDAFIAEFNESGSLSWEKTWGIGDDDDSAMSVIQTSDGGYAVSGDWSDYCSTLVKLTSNGDISWMKLWGYGGGRSYKANSLIQTTSDNYVVITRSNGYDSDDAIFITSFLPNGDLFWDKSYSSVSDDTASSIVESINGGFIIGGKNSSKAFVAEFQQDGELDWTSSLGGINEEGVNSIIKTRDGGYMSIVSSDSYGVDTGTDVDTLLVKYSSDGHISGCSLVMCNATQLIESNNYLDFHLPSNFLGVDSDVVISTGHNPDIDIRSTIETVNRNPIWLKLDSILTKDEIQRVQ